MHQTELFISTVPCLTWERRALVLPGEARVADALDLVDQGQSVHHVAAGEPPQRLEVHVAVPCMPAPAVLATVHGETDRPCG